MVRFVLRHFAADERFARPYGDEPSPKIPLTLPFSSIFGGFFRALLWHKPLSRSWSVASVSVCVRVCGWVLCMLCVVLCFFCSEIWGNWINMDKQTGSNDGRKGSEKMQKNTRNSGKIIKPQTPFFGTIWPSTDRKKVRKRPFSPTHWFSVSPGICRRFSPEVLSQTPKKALFRPRS